MNYLSGSKRKSTNEEEELPSIIQSQLIGCEGVKITYPESSEVCARTSPKARRPYDIG